MYHKPLSLCFLTDLCSTSAIATAGLVCEDLHTYGFKKIGPEEKLKMEDRTSETNASEQEQSPSSAVFSGLKNKISPAPIHTTAPIKYLFSDDPLVIIGLLISLLVLRNGTSTYPNHYTDHSPLASAHEHPLSHTYTQKPPEDELKQRLPLRPSLPHRSPSMGPF